MSLAIPIETSARHIHLCEEDFHTLFGEGGGLTYKADLSQPGQYVCEERLTIQGPKGHFKNVAVLGPFRKETQIEISMTDSRKMGIPGIRRHRRHAGLYSYRTCGKPGTGSRRHRGQTAHPYDSCPGHPAERQGQ